MAKGYYVGVDVGGTKIAAGLVSPGGEVLGWKKTPTPRGAGPARILAVVAELIRDAIRESGRKPRRLKALGVGVPGLVDAKTGSVLAAPNVNLAGYPIAAELGRLFGVEIAIGNDVNLGVLGESWRGAGRGVEDFVGIFPGTGVGGGVISGGRLLTGAHGAAAELGHIVLDPKGPLCGCGARGCLEAYASRTAIERDIRAGVKAGERSGIAELNGGSLDVIKSKVLAKALKRRDPLVTRVMAAAAERLGEGCVAARHCLDPELFVFGGGLIEACGSFLLPLIRRRVAKDPLFKKVGPCRIVPAALGDEAVVLGAAALAREL